MRPYARTENQAAAQERVGVAAQEDGCCDVVAAQLLLKKAKDLLLQKRSKLLLWKMLLLWET